MKHQACGSRQVELDEVLTQRRALVVLLNEALERFKHVTFEAEVEILPDREYRFRQPPAT